MESEYRHGGKTRVIVTIAVAGHERTFVTRCLSDLRQGHAAGVKILLHALASTHQEVVCKVESMDDLDAGASDGLLVLVDARSRANCRALGRRVEAWASAGGRDLEGFPRALLLVGARQPGALSADEAVAELPEPLRGADRVSWSPRLVAPHRFEVRSKPMIDALGERIIIGSAFAFIPADAYEVPKVKTLLRSLALEAPSSARIVSLLDADRALLPGVDVKPTSLPGLRLSSLTSDKMLYREGTEPVHLLVLDPLRPGAQLELDIERNGAAYGQMPLTLDARGVFATALRDLPGGSYRISIDGDGAPPLELSVAEYALAPLTALLADQALVGDRLRFRATLDTFGVPIEGEVVVTLRERGRSLAEVRVQAVAGVLSGELDLTGDGPHDLLFAPAADPGKTAVVPLRGSRRTERELSLFSALGYEVRGSLVPGEDSEEVRGLHLREGALRNTPVRLSEVACDTARLTVLAKQVEELVVVAWDVATGERAEHRLTNPKPGDSIELETPSPLGILLVGAFIAGSPWEGWATIVKTTRLGLQLEAPAEALPGSTVTINVTAGSADAPATVYLIVKDDRLLTQDTPHTRLASRLKTKLDEAAPTLNEGRPTRTLTDSTRITIPNSPAKALEDLAREIVDAALPEDPFADRGAPSPGAAGFFGRDPFAEVIPGAAPFMTPLGAGNFPIGSGRADDDEDFFGPTAGAVFEARAPFGQAPAASDAFAPSTGALDPFSPLAADASSSLLGRSGDPFGAPAPEDPFGAPAAEDPFGAPAPEDPPGFPPAPTPHSAAPRASAYRRKSTPEELPVLDGDALRDHADDLDDDMPDLESAQAEGGERRPPRAAASPQTERPPQVLVAETLEVAGRRAVEVDLPEGQVRYLVEAFGIRGLDWEWQEARLRASRDLYAELTVPPFVFELDAVLGAAHVGSSVGDLYVKVTRDGAPVKVVLGERPVVPEVALPRGQHELKFLCGPGEVAVEVRCAATERVATARRQIDVPGQLVDIAKRLVLLSAGDSLERGGDVLGLRILPSLDQPLKAVIEATGGYAHKCCEQTAAKMLTAMAAWAMSDDDPRRRQQAEEAILAGVRREESMWVRGRGFKMYPESGDHVDDYWSPQATQHLLEFELLEEHPGLTPALKHGVERVLKMAHDTARPQGVQRIPTTIGSVRDAYRLVSTPEAPAADREAALALVRGSGPSPKGLRGAVGERVDASYAAACLLRGGAPRDLPKAIALTNRVARDVGPSGRLYSTVDSVALVALMSELQRSGLVGDGGAPESLPVKVNGQAMSLSEATAFEGPIERVAVEGGLLPVEVTQRVRESWEAFESNLRCEIALEKAGKPGRKFRVGDALELVCRLPDGYQAGDLLHVCLPAAVSRIYGGGHVKRFSIDFQGQAEVRVPLAATGITVGRAGGLSPQRYAVCVRNMFEEERVGSPGLLEVQVRPQDDGADAAAAAGLSQFMGG